MNNLINRSPYLRTSREFPEEQGELLLQLNKSYIDTASAVNSRTIGLFPTNKAAITGEKWFLQNNKPQQSIRQVYTFTSTTSINHEVTTSDISKFCRMWGVYTNGTNYFGLIAGSSVAIAGQISFYLTPTQIVFVTGAGAPTLTDGTIVLEWLSFV